MFKKILCLLTLIVALTAKAENMHFSKYDADFYLTARFLKTAFENKTDNFVVSPLSVYTATTLLANGADGNSKIELEKEILNKEPYLNMDTLNKTLSNYIEQKKDTIKITNIMTGEDFKSDYVGKMTKEFFATLDYKNTKPGEIKLTNIVEFEDFWVEPFKSYNTAVDKFYSLDGQTDEVDMMYDDERLTDYYQDEKMQAIRLPYRDGNVMHIFLPREGVDFKDFIQNLQATDLYLDYHPLPVEIFIPKFSFEYTLDNMIPFYQQWGVKDIFGPKSNLSQLSDTPYYVSKITHKTKIKTDELGTAAYAMTEQGLANFGDTGGSLEPKKWKMIFKANRPFVFMINNGDFVGVYVKGQRQKNEGNVVSGARNLAKAIAWFIKWINER